MNTWFFYYFGFLLFIILEELRRALDDIAAYSLIKIPVIFGSALFALLLYLSKKGYLDP